MKFYVKDTFTRAASNGWGTADTGQPWVYEGGSSTQASVVSPVASHSVATIGTTCRSLLNGAGADVEALYRVMIPSVATGVAAQASFMVRENGANTEFYVFRLLFNTDSTIIPRISIRSPLVFAGAETTLGTAGSQFSYSAGSWVWARALIAGNRLQFRAWADGSAEPSGWMLDLTDSTITSAGRVGFRSDTPSGWLGGNPYTFAYDDVTINPGGDLDNVLGGSLVTWDEPKLMADWRGDGAVEFSGPALSDNFSRLESNGVRSGIGWGNTSGRYFGGGYPWAHGSSANTSISGGVAYLSIAAVNTTYYARTGWGSNTSGGEITFDSQMPVMPTGDSIYINALLNHRDASNYHYAAVEFRTDGTMGWALRRRNNGTITNIATGTLSLTHTAGNWYSWRFQASRPTPTTMLLRFKIWLAGTDEPSGWSGSTTDTLIVWNGLVGMSTNALTANTNTLPVAVGFRNFVGLGTSIGRLRVGDGWATGLSLDTGAPSEVQHGSADGVPKVSAALMAPTGWNSPGEYFSRVQPGSPLYGMDRDVAAVTMDVPVISPDGPQSFRVFTGQMSDVATDSTTATLTGISASRNRMRAAVQPPAIDSRTWGLYSGAQADWIAWQCGLYSGISPTNKYYVALAQPFHGTAMPYNKDSTYMEGSLNRASFTQQTAGSSIAGALPDFRDGGPWNAPYLYSQLTTALDQHFRYNPANFYPSNTGGNYWPLMSPTSSVQWNCYVRGDVVSTPGPGGTPANLVSWELQCSYPSTSAKFTFGINISRNIFLTINDGVNSRTLFSGSNLPSDGKWHTVGVSYDIAANYMAVWIDGTVSTSTPSPAISVANLADGDTWDTANGFPVFYAYLPIADHYIWGGALGKTSVYGWNFNNGSADAATATIRLGSQKIYAWAVPAPREAFEILAEISQAELAWFGFDVNDRLLWLPVGYWAEAEQQPAAPDVLSTVADVRAGIPASVAPDILIQEDVTKVYNQAIVTWRQPAINLQSILYQGSPGLKIAYGYSQIRIPFSNPALFIDLFDVSQTSFANIPTMISGRNSYINANSSTTGSGIDWLDTSGSIQGNLFMNVSADPGGITFTFNNFQNYEWYIVSSDSSRPAISLWGTSYLETEGSVYAQDDSSASSRRGPRLLGFDGSGIKSSQWAAVMAAELVNRYRYPRKIVTATVMPDPRRKPGDMVILRDPATGLDGRFRLVEVDTQGTPGGLLQTILAEQAWTVGGGWDNTIWDDGSIWGA
jgi:hypothetical protein